MIRTYLPLSDYIFEILCKEKATKLIVDDKELDTLRELEIVFGIFEEATNIFQVLLKLLMFELKLFELFFLNFRQQNIQL